MPIQYDVQSFRDLKAWFQGFIDFQRATGCERSCPMGTIANSLTDDQKDIRADVDRVFRSSRDVLSAVFEDLGKGRLVLGRQRIRVRGCEARGDLLTKLSNSGSWPCARVPGIGCRSDY
jgi:hypothetical protein